MAGVDDWEHKRINEVRGKAARRRDQHRVVGAAAVARMQKRGETFVEIAELAGVKVSDLCAVLKAISARTATRPRSERADSGAEGSAEAGAAEVVGTLSLVGVKPWGQS
jgi:hypothetical protein